MKTTNKTNVFESQSGSKIYTQSGFKNNQSEASVKSNSLGCLVIAVLIFLAVLALIFHTHVLALLSIAVIPGIKLDQDEFRFYSKIQGYSVIDKACNGTFILYKNEWHMITWITGRCYNSGQSYVPGKNEIVIETNDFINDTILITKKVFSLDWINSLPVNCYQATW